MAQINAPNVKNCPSLKISHSNSNLQTLNVIIFINWNTSCGGSPYFWISLGVYTFKDMKITSETIWENQQKRKDHMGRTCQCRLPHTCLRGSVSPAPQRRVAAVRQTRACRSARPGQNRGPIAPGFGTLHFSSFGPHSFLFFLT